VGTVGRVLEGYEGGINGGVPLVLFDALSGPRVDTLLVSPLRSFKSAFFSTANRPQDLFGGGLACGINGQVLALPRGFSTETLLLHSKGLTETLRTWGQLLQQQSGKLRRTHTRREVGCMFDRLRESVSSRLQGLRGQVPPHPARPQPHLPVPKRILEQCHASSGDTFAHVLGYWTDNGAYYYHQTVRGKNYEETLQLVREHHASIRVPVCYYQIDSWWYHRCEGGDLALWQPLPHVFPHGLPGVVDLLHTPLAAHSKVFSKSTEYQSRFRFKVDNKALPVDPLFWDHLMGYARNNSILVYEQDWLVLQHGKIMASQRDVSSAREALAHMAEAAARHGVTLQYCMALPSDYLQASEFPAVTQIRVSDDYHHGTHQWNIGRSSMFAWALGMYPFKDAFWSMRSQPDNKYGLEEPNSALHAAVSLLSCGPVAIGDSIGHTDSSLVMRTCMSNGILLHPDRPAFLLEREFRAIVSNSGRFGEVWCTYTAVGAHVWMWVLAVGLDAPQRIALADLAEGLPPDLLPAVQGSFLSRAVFPALDEHMADLSSTQPLVVGGGAATHAGGSDPSPMSAAAHALADAAATARLEQQGFTQQEHVRAALPFSLVHIAPVLPCGWVLLGEASKFVAVSNARVTALSCSAGTRGMLALAFRGAFGEVVTWQLMRMQPPAPPPYRAQDIVEVRCVVSPSLAAEVVCEDGGCRCN